MVNLFYKPSVERRTMTELRRARLQEVREQERQIAQARLSEFRSSKLGARERELKTAEVTWLEDRSAKCSFYRSLLESAISSAGSAHAAAHEIVSANCSEAASQEAIWRGLDSAVEDKSSAAREALIADAERERQRHEEAVTKVRETKESFAARDRHSAHDFVEYQQSKASKPSSLTAGLSTSRYQCFDSSVSLGAPTLMDLGRDRYQVTLEHGLKDTSAFKSAEEARRETDRRRAKLEELQKTRMEQALAREQEMIAKLQDRARCRSVERELAGLYERDMDARTQKDESVAREWIAKKSRVLRREHHRRGDLEEEFEKLFRA